MFRRHYYYHTHTPLGDLYEHNLRLNRKEVSWLNKFTPPGNGLMQLEAPRGEAVRLYLLVMNELETKCKAAGTTFQQQAKELTEKSEQYGYFNHREQGYVSSAAAGSKVAAIVYFTVLQRCEDVVRHRYGMPMSPEKRYFTAVLDTAHSFERYFGEAVQALLAPLAKTVPLPDDETEQALNVLDNGRYKPHFEKLLALLPTDTVGFAAGVYELCYLNNRNPVMPQIYYEATKQLGELVRAPALHLYLHYLHYGAACKWNFKPRPLIKRLQKKLFPQPEHQERFEAICQSLLHSRDLNQATTEVAKVYFQERKKITLDMGTVQAVRAQHAGTVELLNEYLQDTPAPPAAKPPKKAPAAPKPRPPKPPKAPALAATFAAGVQLTALQQALLALFAAHQLALPQAAVEAFAKTHGTLRNQLIDGLNEACADLLDDVLVEETADGYAIYEPYYQKITAQCSIT
ncbi:tellurite resistance TerB C-terminal domain-containing protein [Hymenobacter siberiensis]|uniref:tellurite resistance TerB C-terminal domain-containing protein n=1 Tax=Hymenobacter siberiensis TaxID=2848396 RepID=UPI001C1E6782|nr:tellurite resistance TerB C-terminal domain-containing protein [Hymenobacter siberiensis]MBU6120850.1 hypothetical protein [Hymenobacter siberiensis]